MMYQIGIQLHVSSGNFSTKSSYKLLHPFTIKQYISFVSKFVLTSLVLKVIVMVIRRNSYRTKHDVLLFVQIVSSYFVTAAILTGDDLRITPYVEF